MMTLPTFGQLLAEYMNRSGISDSELARSIGVRRQTIFRWKEGLVERPRAREDVLQCAKKLRLSDDERDRLLLAAGFAPEQLNAALLRDVQEERVTTPTPEPTPEPTGEPATDRPVDLPMMPVAGSTLNTAPVVDTPAALDPPLLTEQSITSVANLDQRSTSVTPPSLPPRVGRALALLADRRLRWWPAGAGLLVLLLLGLLWTRRTPLVVTVTPTPPLPATVELHAPPQTTPVNLGDYPVATEGETLLLVAQFKNFTLDTPYNVAGRISEELGQQIAAAELISTTVMNWPEEITTVLRARQLLTAANAAMVIWGEYDIGRVRVNLEARDPQASISHNFKLTSGDELVLTINEIVPQSIRDLALLALDRLVRDPDNYQMNVGLLLRDKGNYEAATILFERALEQPKDDVTAANLHFYLGYLAQKSDSIDQYDRAIVHYTHAFALNPRLVNALYNRGTVQLWRTRLLPASESLILESLNAAIDDLTQVIAQRSGYINAYLNRAIAYYERDNPDDMTAALTDLNHVITIKPDYTSAYFNRALVHLRAGVGVQWVDDFQKTLALDPKQIGAISGLCWGYALAQQPAKALPYCNQAVLLDQTGTSNDSRGIVYIQLGRYPEAIADFRLYLAALQQEQAVTLYERYRGPLIESWITQLEAGQNPLTNALLEKLRHRDHY